MKKGIWKNKKYGKHVFVAHYAFDHGVVPRGRYMVLVSQKNGRRVEVESHEAAKKLGWVFKR